MEKVKNFFIDLFLNKGLLLVYAVLALVIGLIVIKLVLKITEKCFRKSKMEKITQSFLLSILKAGLYFLLIIIIMQILGIPTTGLIALFSACGLAISLALQDSLSNLANGIVIITTKPFHEGDFVKIEDVEGKVKSIHILTTELETADGKLIVLPNSAIVKSSIINYNVTGHRRVNYTFCVDYASDVKQIREIILSVMNSNGKVLRDPAPFVALDKLNDNSIDFFASCWCDSEDYWDVYYYVIDNVFNEFKRNNINIPFNQMEVRIRKDDVVLPYNKETLPTRVEKVHKEPKKDFIDAMAETLFDVDHKIKKRKKEKHGKKKNKTNENISDDGTNTLSTNENENKKK